MRVAVQRAAQRIHGGERGEERAAAEFLPVTQKDLEVRERRAPTITRSQMWFCVKSEAVVVTQSTGREAGKSESNARRSSVLNPTGRSSSSPSSRRCSICG